MNKLLTLMMFLALSMPAHSALVVESEAELRDWIENRILLTSGAENIDFSRLMLIDPNGNSMEIQTLADLQRYMPFQGDIRVTLSEVDAAGKRFNFQLMQPRRHQQPTVLSLQGRYEVMVPVPALVRDIPRGEMISASDVSEINVPERALRSHHIQETTALVGKQAARNLQQGEPIPVRHVKDYEIVKKGKIVPVIYRSRTMELRAMAEALEDGVKGQVITLENIDSGQRIKAMVMENGELLVNYREHLAKQLIAQREGE